jgi:hypothetical protein
MIKAKRERYVFWMLLTQYSFAKFTPSIRNKLRVLGWERQEIELSDDLKRQWDRIVDVPTPLTERSM